MPLPTGPIRAGIGGMPCLSPVLPPSSYAVNVRLERKARASIISHHFERDRRGFAAANTQARNALGLALLFERVEQRYNDTCA